MKLLNLLSFRGRIGRREYFQTGVGLFLALLVGELAIVAAFMHWPMQASPLQAIFWWVALLSWPWLSMGLRRAHDVGHSSTWYLRRAAVSVGCAGFLLERLIAVAMGGSFAGGWLALAAFLVMLVVGGQVSAVLGKQPGVEGANAYGAPDSGSIFRG